MTESPKPEIGSIGWIDLTVEDAPRIPDFYQAVVGWKIEPVDMDDYSDFNLSTPESGTAPAGVCHARGSNASLPVRWMIYVTVADVDDSADRCQELGGRLLVWPKSVGGHGRDCVIQDPAGAVCALFQPADRDPWRAGSSRNTGHFARTGTGQILAARLCRAVRGSQLSVE